MVQFFPGPMQTKFPPSSCTTTSLQMQGRGAYRQNCHLLSPLLSTATVAWLMPGANAIAARLLRSQLYTGIYKYTQVYTGIYGYIQVYTGIHRYIQVYTSIKVYTGIHSSDAWLVVTRRVDRQSLGPDGLVVAMTCPDLTYK